jgi:hypothetical protein
MLEFPVKSAMVSFDKIEQQGSVEDAFPVVCNSRYREY